MAIIQDYIRQEELAQSDDTLTGLPEMHGFLKLLSHIILAYQQGDIIDDLDVVYFDLRNFSFFNAEYGMGEGDRFLRKISEILCEVFVNGFCSHFDADHFVVLTTHDDVYENIERVCKAVKCCHPAAMFLAAGVYRLQKTDAAASACDKAKIACDHAGSEFGCQYRDYSQELSNAIQLNKYLMDHIDEAVEKGWIRTYYQPVMRTISGDICSVEALARWIDPVHGFLAPDVFISVLEHNHLIHKLDLCMLENICRDYSKIIEKGCVPISFSLNLSRLDFERDDLHTEINSILSKYKVPREMIHMEITESSLHGSEEFIQNHIEHFHQDGYQIWMDDFGAGYSSLNTLQNYDFDLIKIDMHFLRRANHKTSRILSAIVSMAKDLGIRTLAEGVETEEQLAFLRQIGCEKAQGYYISKPLPMDELFNVLTEKNLAFENLLDNYFYDNVGRINVMSNNPLAVRSERIHNPESDSTFAIMVIEHQKLKTLYYNQNFERMIRDFGHPDITQLDHCANTKKMGGYGTFCDRLLQIANDNEIVSFDFVENDMSGRYRVRRITDLNRKTAYAVQLINLTGTTEQDQARQRNETLRDIFSLFEIVNVVNPVEDTIDYIYQNHAYKTFHEEALPYCEEVKLFTNHNIYPEDRPLFLEFADPTTIRERILHQENQVLEDYFRMLSKDGGYSWHQFLIVGTPDHEVSNRYLFCIRPTSNSKLSSLIGGLHFCETMESVKSNDEVPAEILWNSAIQFANLGIFWKDAERRFISANRMFLDYYGFASVDEIRGKTDEDMGWHVDPGPYRDVEWKVIHEGLQSRNVPGTCIVHGERRQIAASKVPIYDEGRVVGLIGYFKDVTSEENEKMRMRDAVLHDSVTGLLNRIGIRNSCLDYEESYIRYNQDFAYLILNLLNFKRFNDAFGHNISDHLLKEVGELICETVGVNSTIGHVGGDGFIVVFQYDDPEEKEAMKQKISTALENIHEVHNVGYTAYFYMGMAAYSETHSVDELEELAYKRLRENYVNVRTIK